MMNLTIEKVREITTEQDETLVKVLNVSRKDIRHLHDLSSCLKLEKLDLSYNVLTNFKGIRDCHSLTWLNISHNQIESLSAVCQLCHLRVLNASHNNITKCGDLSRLTELKALILNNNGELSTIHGLDKLRSLNTLVLSHNSFEEVDGLSSLSWLTKLSLSHNSLQAVPNISSNSELSELRLNGNRIKKLDSNLQSNTKLRVLDIGNNRIKKLKNIQVLKELRGLRNLNVKGNPLYNSRDDEMIKIEIRQLLPKLEVLDGNKAFRATASKPEGKASKLKSTKTHEKSSKLDNDTSKDITEGEKTEIAKDDILEEVLHTIDDLSSQTRQNKDDKGTKRGSETRKRPRGRSNVVSIKDCHVKTKKAKIDSIELKSALDGDTVYGVGGVSLWD